MIKFVRYSLTCFLAFFLFTGKSVAQVENTNRQGAIKVQLLSDKASIALDDETSNNDGLLIGIKIDIEEGWHFIGQSVSTELLEPTILWDIPERYSVEKVNHPKPSFDYGGFMDTDTMEIQFFLLSHA